MSMSDDEIRGLMAGPFPRTKPTAGFIAFARAVERAARAAAFDDAIAACGAEAAGFRENRLWEAIDGETLLALLDALDEARAERDAAMALLRECDEVAVSLCGVADLVEHGDLFARIDAILGGDKGA